MKITPDQVVYWRWGWVQLNATIVNTWLVMALLAGGSWLITRNLSRDVRPPRGQNVLEILVLFIRNQVRELTLRDPTPYLPFIGTLFLYISLANLLGVVPYFQPPTGSLSTTAALATCVFVAVPLYSIAHEGWIPYLKHYVQPSPLMFPFHVIGELSRTLALAIRLFGNIMSGSLAAGIIVSLAPLFFPVLLHVLDLIIGQVQAYIFAVLATVYIASGTREDDDEPPPTPGDESQIDPFDHTKRS